MSDVDLNAINTATTALAAPAAPVVLNTAAPAAPATLPTEPAAPAPAPFYSALPEDWRKQVIEGVGAKDADADKLAKHLERYTDLPNALKAGYEAAQKIRQGLVSTGLPENPTPEELATYREARGIPSDPAQYEIKLADGLQMFDDDTRIMGEVNKIAHKHNIPASVMNDLVNTMLQSRAVEVESLQARDVMEQQEAHRVLKEHWGAGNYPANSNAAAAFLQRLPESIRGDLVAGRLANGKAILNSPEVVSFFAQMERELNPAGSVVPNSANPVQAVRDELAVLEKRMRTDNNWYKDTAAQSRYMELVTANQRIAS